MKVDDKHLDRLLRSAASAPDEPVTDVPLGFATRVVASWGLGRGRNGAADLTHFLRRIDAIAIVVFLLAGIGVYWQFNDNETRTAPQTNEYAIADSAIQTEFSP
jgi:hypothetical protein